MTAIDAVRARLQRDLSLRLIHRDTAGDVQALLDHHAELLKAAAIDLGQFRAAVGYMIDCAETDAELSDARRLLALIDGQAEPRPLIARQLAEWHEDDGPAMWWAWCGSDWAGEPAWCGTPNDSDWPGYHTHWTPHPAMPMQPTKGEGE